MYFHPLLPPEKDKFLLNSNLLKHIDTGRI